MYPAAYLAYKHEYTLIAFLVCLVLSCVYFGFFYQRKKRRKEKEAWSKVLEESRKNQKG
jgi:preprotein translocase subunit YajC